MSNWGTFRHNSGTMDKPQKPDVFQQVVHFWHAPLDISISEDLAAPRKTCYYFAAISQKNLTAAPCGPDCPGNVMNFSETHVPPSGFAGKCRVPICLTCCTKFAEVFAEIRASAPRRHAGVLRRPAEAHRRPRKYRETRRKPNNRQSIFRAQHSGCCALCVGRAQLLRCPQLLRRQRATLAST